MSIIFILVAIVAIFFVSKQILQKKPQETNVEENQDSNRNEKIIILLRNLGCKVTLLGKFDSDAEKSLTEQYIKDATIQRQNGFVRVLVEMDELFTDNLFIEFDEHLDDLERHIQERLATPMTDARAIFDERLTELKKIYSDSDSEDSIDWETDIIGTNVKLEQDEALKHIELGGKTDNLIAVDVPVMNAYDIFCYLPFGGPESPSPMEQRSIAKYWFEKYGAVPCYMSGDVLQYYVEHPVKENDAYNLALQQLGFCPDIVTQGYDTVKHLEKILSRSSFWFFWWD